MFEYKIIATDETARVGEFTTPHGVITTPVFMPVGTHGAVKSVSPRELETIGSQIILGNTYHLYLRPGEDTVAEAGGLHGFMNWNHPILTDSGGFQVFSLGERSISGKSRQPLRKISEEGITFRSHLDGSQHFISPERSIEIQQKLGADIMMAFDQPVYGLSDHSTTAEAVSRTHRWLERSKTQWQKGDTTKQALFGIVQGGTHTDLHTQSAAFISELDLPGNAIGGLAVGEEKEEMWRATDSICPLLPENKPRYFMGLGGEPEDLLQATLRGVDMYDCVAPTRLARHGVIWQLSGEKQLLEAFWKGDTDTLLKGFIKTERWNLKNASFGRDVQPLSQVTTTLPDDLQEYTLAALHHYLEENEMLGYRILTLHNIAILHMLTLHMRNAIHNGKLKKLATVFGISTS